MIDMWPLGVGQRLHLKRLFPPVSLTGAHPPYHHGVTYLSYLPGQWGTQLAKHTHIWNISRFLNKKEMESGPLMFCCTPGSCCRQLGKHLRVDKSKPGFRHAALPGSHTWAGASPSWNARPPVTANTHPLEFRCRCCSEQPAWWPLQQQGRG